MRLSHTFSIDRGRASSSLLLRWTPLLAALILAAALANAQTKAPGEPNRDDAAMRTLDQSSHAQTNEVAPPEDQAQPMNPPEPHDAGPSMMPPPTVENTVDAPPSPMTAPGDNPEVQRAPEHVPAKSPTAPAAATPSHVITPNPPASAKREERKVAPVAGDPQPTAPAVADFSAFKIISERNIFDPNRSPRRAGGPARRDRTVESVTLVGIMSYGKGDFAFFNGTSSEHKKVLKASDTIAGYKLASIGANSVRLSAGEKEVELKIGSQLRREEEGEWTVSTQAEAYAATPAASSASASKPAEAGAASNGADSEVLKRLMQRREQE